MFFIEWSQKCLGKISHNAPENRFFEFAKLKVFFYFVGVCFGVLCSSMYSQFCVFCGIIFENFAYDQEIEPVWVFVWERKRKTANERPNSALNMYKQSEWIYMIIRMRTILWCMLFLFFGSYIWARLCENRGKENKNANGNEICVAGTKIDVIRVRIEPHIFFSQLLSEHFFFDAISHFDSKHTSTN